jgi:hypothetical protein
MDTGINTDPRILTLLFAVMAYFDAKKTPVNPFVKGYGVSKEVEEADTFLAECLAECSDYFDEVKEMVEILQNTEVEESQIENQVD